jgi:hypothetical protein
MVVSVPIATALSVLKTFGVRARSQVAPFHTRPNAPTAGALGFAAASARVPAPLSSVSAVTK